jgi:hypothetical protein
MLLEQFGLYVGIVDNKQAAVKLPVTGCRMRTKCDAPFADCL